MIRALDILLSLTGLVLLFPVMVLIALAGLADTGAPFFLQQRVGRHQKMFTLIKFRTMKRNTKHLPTHLVDVASVTTLGRFLRRTKLDELPQLLNVLIGDMSLVGPRPCLPQQEALIAARVRLGVLRARPGITGLAQIQGIDMSDPEHLAMTDARMLENLNVLTYLGYIVQTLLGKGAGDRVRIS